MSDEIKDLKLESVMLSRREIDARVAEIAAAIREDYRGQELIVVCVLKGAAIFMVDLVRAIGSEVDIRMDFMAVSSYGDSSTSSGVVKIIKDIDSYPEGKNVLLVEDIMDSGLTLFYLRDVLMAKNPKSFKTCVLLEKPERSKIKTDIDYKGFVIPDKFVVGYGLDYAGKWRHLSDIWAVSV